MNGDNTYFINYGDLTQLHINDNHNYENRDDNDNVIMKILPIIVLPSLLPL